MKTYKRSFKNYFIDKQFQTKYFLITILLLLIYTFIFTAVLFFPSILTLYFDSSIEEKTEAARTFLVLHNTVWPTTGVVILIFGFLSIFLTHKIAGPVYRIKHALTELIDGNFGIKIRLRRWDDFQALAEQVNILSETLHSHVNTLKKDHELLFDYIEQLEQEIGTQETGRKVIEKVKEQQKAIAVTLEDFTSKP
jgi:signal transduction histidine kinase